MFARLGFEVLVLPHEGFERDLKGCVKNKRGNAKKKVEGQAPIFMISQPLCARRLINRFLAIPSHLPSISRPRKI